MALAPTDWATMDSHIQTLGGQVGYGMGVGQLMDHLMTSGAQKVPVADVGTMQQTMIKEGFLPPGTKVTGTWDANTAAAFKAFEDYNYNLSQQGQKAGGSSIHQFLGWLSDVVPSKVGQALVGTAKFLFSGIAHTVQRLPLEVESMLQGNIGNVQVTAPPGTDLSQHPDVLAQAQQLGLSQSDLVAGQGLAEKLQAKGLKTGTAGGLEDLSTFLSLLPILRGAGVLTSGLSAAATQAAETSLTTAAEGTVSKGLIATIVRKALAKGGEAALADTPAAVGDGLDAFASRTSNLRSLGQGFLNTADQVAGFKSSALGQRVTTVLNAATQTAIGERAVANVTSGTIAPNITIGKQERSALGTAIDNTPTLGHSWTLPGPLGILGNPLDLSAFIWAPTKALPIGASPKIGDMANSLERITPTQDILPVLRNLGMNRQQFIESFGDGANAETSAAHFLRYANLQAAIERDATQWVRSVKNLIPGDPGWQVAQMDRAQEISGVLKADPLKMEAAIASVDPVDLLHQMRYMFKDNPELLARRGQAGPVLRDFYDAATSMRGTTAADVAVDPFPMGAKIWSSANQADLDAALQDQFPQVENQPPLRHPDTGEVVQAERAGKGVLPASRYAFTETARGRFAQALSSDATIALRRGDNPLLSAQQLAPWKQVWDRLGSVSRSVEQRIGEAGDDPNAVVSLPNHTQLSDLTAAGFSPDAVTAVRNPDRLGLTGAKLAPADAQRLLDNLNSRIDELRGKMNDFHDETKDMSDTQLSTYSNKLAQAAPRDVTLADEALHARLLGHGYQPIAIHPNAITLNDVGVGTADGLANAATISPVAGFLGADKLRPEELQFMRTQSTENALSTAVNADPSLAQNGKELLGQVWDIAQQATDAGKRVPGTNLTLERKITDLRQLTPRMIQDYGGFSPDQAWAIHSAIRQGAAFGFDISRPIQTMHNFGEAMRYNGLPGMEDAIRTLASLKPNTGVPWIDGPAGHILNLPDNLARLRDFIQFSMNPQFTMARMFKTKILRATSDLPFDFNPAQRIQDLADESGNSDEFYQRFNDNADKVNGGRSHYVNLLENSDFGVKNPGSGLFSWTNEHARALDAWHMAEAARASSGIAPDADLSAQQYQQIGDKLQSLYGYGARSGLEKSANYIFFPLSFDLKVGKALSGWMLQNPARILATNMGLQAYNQANANNRIGGFFDQYLPILAEVNKLNFFASGFHTQLSPIGGRNTVLWNMGKDANALIQGDPRLGAYVPISVSDENLPTMMGLMGNLIPMWRQMQTGSKALQSQYQAVTQGGAEQWQVDNYYQEMKALKQQVSISLGNAGLKPSFSTLTDPFGNPNSKISPEFFNQVQAAIGQVEAKYPAGAAFAKQTTADYQTRATALDEMLRTPVKSRAQASMLYFAAAYYDLQAQAQSTARANAATGRAGRQLYQQVAGAMAAGTTPPTLPGDLDAAQVASLRRLALGLSDQSGPMFEQLWNHLFASELGKLSAYEQAPGVTGPGQTTAAA